MTQQEMFGGQWTQRKLELLKKYLSAWRKIFERNARARFFETNYVDAFAGTGEIPRPKLKGLFEGDPYMLTVEQEFRKGSVRRALEVNPPFHHYIFIEKDRKKCDELSSLKNEFSGRDIEVVNDDANTALLKWCRGLDTKRQRAVVFLDPFGASVEWRVIEAIADTKSVDLWILFPYGAITRMLVNDGMPPRAWAARLTRIFGTAEWEKEFYSTTSWKSLITDEPVKRVYRTADQEKITKFFVRRLQEKFVAVANPGFLYNSRSLLFVLLFAAGNEKGADAGLRIANGLLRDLNKSSF